MSILFFYYLFIFYQFKFIIGEAKDIKIGESRTYLIDYKDPTNFNFIFDLEGQDSVQVNIHGINCNFQLDYTGELINKINLDTYSIIIESNNNEITINPLLDVIDGQFKENYQEKYCPISINSYFINDQSPQIKIENEEDNIFYLDNSKYDLLNISYVIKEVSFDSFATLSFIFSQKSHLNINITYKNNKNQINNTIENTMNTTNIFLNSEFFLFDKEANDTNVIIEGGDLIIEITNEDKKNIDLHFRIIEKDTVSLLEKDAFTFGFLTSKTTYQYYYTQIFKGEEGELMLHNKLLYGILYGKIVEKKDMNKTDLKNISNYPKSNDVNNIIYNPHLLKLNFTYINTSHCYHGCYLLITYEQKQSEEDFPEIGYEFTILTRFWNYRDYISKIVDIPYNEYLLGAFEKGSISHHYYSLTIPDDAEKLIIQIRGNYLDGFYGEGRVKINTMKNLSNTYSLNIMNPQEVLTLNINELNFREKTISFAFRSKDYHEDIFSFYYFRVLYTKKDEKLYFPIDSYIGNLCKPKIDYTTNLYYCYLMLKNNFNGLSTKFAITSATQNEYFKIYSTKYPIEEDSEKTIEFLFLNTELNKTIDLYLFKFEFPNNEIKNIKSSFSDKIEELYPQIYTIQMFYITNSTKINYFHLVNNYTLKYQYVNGNGGEVNLSLLNFETFKSSRNFKGKPLKFPLDSDKNNVTCSSVKENYIYFLELEYNMRNKGVEEIKSGETISNFIKGGYFPLYYYLKIKNKNYINVNINLRLNSYNDSVLHNNFSIRGYVYNEETIKRKINGENINLINPIEGNYSDTFKVGLLKINQAIKDNNNYILIEIISNPQIYIESFMLLELVSKEINDDIYFLPINQYILETFDGPKNETRNETRYENYYYLSSKEKENDFALIELSSGYKDIMIEFKYQPEEYEFDYFKGFNKYRVKKVKDDNVYFKVVNRNNRTNVNYMIRYYYTGGDKRDKYIIDVNPKINEISKNDKNVSISLTFKPIKLNFNYDVKKVKIYFYIYGYLFQLNSSSDELINTTSFLNTQISKFETKIKHNHNYYHPENWTLVFKDIPRAGNLIYDLQLKINSIIENNIFNEQFLILTTKIDLTEFRIKSKLFIWITIGTIGGALVIFLAIFFIIKYIRLQKSNVNLKEELKSLAYSNDVQKDVLKKDQKDTKKDADYESTFI